MLRLKVSSLRGSLHNLTEKIKRGKNKSASRYLLYPEYTILNTISQGSLLEIDFIGKKFIQGRTEPICKLKDKEIERAGAIESNVNKVIASRFKKRGMSWSRPGALALLKIKETIINGEWDIWWETERERNIKVDKYKPPLPASCFKKEAETSPLIEVTIPAFIGPDQGKPWVGVLRKLTEVGYY